MAAGFPSPPIRFGPAADRCRLSLRAASVIAGTAIPLSPDRVQRKGGRHRALGDAAALYLFPIFDERSAALLRPLLVARRRTATRLVGVSAALQQWRGGFGQRRRDPGQPARSGRQPARSQYARNRGYSDVAASRRPERSHHPAVGVGSADRFPGQRLCRSRSGTASLLRTADVALCHAAGRVRGMAGDPRGDPDDHGGGAPPRAGIRHPGCRDDARRRAVVFAGSGGPVAIFQAERDPDHLRAAGRQFCADLRDAVSRLEMAALGCADLRSRLDPRRGRAVWRSGDDQPILCVARHADDWPDILCYWR